MYSLVFDIGHNKFRFTEKCLEANPSCNIVAVDAIDFSKWAKVDDESRRDFNEAIATLSRLKSKYGDRIQVYNNIVTDEEGCEETINIHTVATGKSTAMDMDEHMDQSRFFNGNKYILEEYNNVMTTHTGIKTPLEEYIMGLKHNYGSVKNAISTAALPYYQEETVLTTTLDSLISKEGVPDLIKIDVEGYEHKVIKGLTEKANKICFEFTEEMDYCLYESFLHLQSLGYESFGICGFFEEGNGHRYLTYDSGGDTAFREPEEYFSMEYVMLDLRKILHPKRRINWGMAWVK